MCSSKRIKEENCGNRSINIDVLEDLIWQRFFADQVLKDLVEKHFDNNDIEDPSNSIKAKLTILNKDLEDNDKQNSNAIRMNIKGLINDNEFERERKRIRIEKEDIQIKIEHLEEDIYTYENANNYKNKIVKNLYSIKKNTSFNEKQKLIDKYIKEINIVYISKVNIYFIIIDINIVNFRSDFFIIHKSYDYAFESLRDILIPLSDNYKNLSENDLSKKLKELKNFLEPPLNVKKHK